LSGGGRSGEIKKIIKRDNKRKRKRGMERKIEKMKLKGKELNKK